jgi:ribosome modulation factor
MDKSATSGSEPSAAWRPIESAPRDGTPLLLVVAGYQPSVGIWFVPPDGLTPRGKLAPRWLSIDPEGVFETDEGLVDYIEGSEYLPTHWMPLPSPPLTARDTSARCDRTQDEPESPLDRLEAVERDLLTAQARIGELEGALTKTVDGFSVALDSTARAIEQSIQLRVWENFGPIARSLRMIEDGPLLTDARALLNAEEAPADDEAQPWPSAPWPPGADTNAKIAGWNNYFGGKSRERCPFPPIRRDLQAGYREGWDAAKQTQEP